ncbi:cellulase family glycosylhydrolase [Vibrio quintilis]|uniref:Endoglucanase n=1 Tax=Vibrio quintilis TaxID=1117707 RepID=A0A1M7YSA5_9VIBR|nr:cellulase family glycosylhydrolase [Vibrio quintilis]SHO55499.1 Endoglucanase C precursor [Vibrio quintilis]
MRKQQVFRNVSCKKRALSIGIGLALAALSGSTFAKCVYEIQSDWGTGFTANVTVTNDTSSAVSTWNVGWEYSKGATITNLWNGSLSGTNPYTVTNAGHNGSLQPGSSATFGFQATGTPETPTLSGTLCSGTTPPTPTPQEGNQVVFRVNDDGRITKDGTVKPVHCGSWFGLEGRHELPTDSSNPNGAPMELYVGNTFWANNSQGTGRTIQQTMDEIKAKGINLIRLPIAPQTLDADDPQGQPAVFKNHSSVRATNARSALEEFIKLADENDLDILLDIHSCSNYLGWRAGRLDATPPYTDANRNNYIYTREDYSCGTDVGDGVTVQEYNEQKWLEDLRQLARFADELDVNNILGIDIFNEPWDYTWSEWKTLAEHAYEAINEENENVLVWVEGIGSAKSDGTKNPHGDEDLNPNWGENFYSMATDPLDIPKNRLVISPHTYGPSVSVQPQFVDQTDSDCVGLSEDAAAKAKCNIVIKPAMLKKGWEEHFGYLKDKGYAVILGEFGGHYDWPKSGAIRIQDLWDFLPNSDYDKKWQNALVDYMSDKKIEGCYWGINPESDDTGGLYTHAYDARTNTSGWGEWTGFETEKWEMLQRLWDADDAE